MKIALVSQEYPPETSWGGIATQTYAKAQGLSELGHEVYVISRKDTRGTRIRTGNIEVIRLPAYHDYFYEPENICDWKNHSEVINAELIRLNNDVGLDIIDFPEWAAEAYTYLTKRNKGTYVPAVIQLHGPLVMFGHIMGWPDMNSDFYKIGTEMEAQCLHLADGVYTSSECSANWVREYYNYNAETIPVIHTGVDTELFSPKELSKNEQPTILYAGKIVLNKGVEELIESCIQLVKKYPKLKLVMIGNGNENYIQRLKDRTTKAGAENLLELKGYIQKTFLPEEFSPAHIFAAPSHYEGGPGFVYLEAMACGLPVIGCSGSGVEEIINNGINGMLVEPKNIPALYTALDLLLSDSNKVIEMGIKAREYVLAEADSKNQLKKLEAFYLSILKNITITR